MKNILVAVVFLFSQMGYSAQKRNPAESKKTDLENRTFSELILTKDEIIHLNEEDQTKYLFSMIALAQIVEGSQRFHMDYEDKFPRKDSSEVGSPSDSKYSNLLKLTIPQAQAFIQMLAVRALVVMEPLMANAARWVSTRVATAMAGRAGAVVAVSEPQIAMDTIQAGARVLVTKKGAIEAATKTALENAQKLKEAEKAIEVAAKNKAGFAEAGKNYERAKDTVFRADKERFLEAGGNEKQFEKIVNDSGIKKVFMWTNKNKVNLVTSGFAGYGADVLAKDKLGMSLTEMLENSAVSAYHMIVPGTGLSLPAGKNPKVLATAAVASAVAISGTTTPSTKETEIADSKKEKDKTCLFGGVASFWKEFDGGVIKCTRPTLGSNETCKGEDGFFKCPDYGIKLTVGSLDSNICIPTYSLNDLTVRCSKSLMTVLKTKKASVDPTTMADYIQKNFGEVIKQIESGDHMKDLDGKTKSIIAYCSAKSLEQKDECAAIREVLAVLKDTNAPSLIAARAASEGTAPANIPDSWGAEGRH